MTDSERDTMLHDIKESMGGIFKRLESLPCKVNVFRLGLIEKIVFGGVAIILICFMYAASGRTTGIKATTSTGFTVQQIHMIQEVIKKSMKADEG